MYSIKKFVKWIKKLLTGYEERDCVRSPGKTCSYIKGVPLRCDCRKQYFEDKVSLYIRLNENRKSKKLKED